MKLVNINVKTREAVGTGSVKRLRDSGQIPAVIYGESGVRHLSLNAAEFQVAWRKIGGRAALIELHTEGESETTYAVINEIQKNNRRDTFEHLDFHEVVRGKEMEAHIPVETKGTAFGVKNQQGIVEINTHELTVRCLPRHLPESITIDVSDLKVGESIHLAALPVIDDVTFRDEGDLVMVSCVAASAGKSGAAAAAAEEVEVEAEAPAEA